MTDPQQGEERLRPFPCEQAAMELARRGLERYGADADVPEYASGCAMGFGAHHFPTVARALLAAHERLAEWEEGAANLLLKREPGWTTMPSKPAFTIGQIERILESTNERLAEVERERDEARNALETHKEEFHVAPESIERRVTELEDTLSIVSKRRDTWRKRAEQAEAALAAAQAEIKHAYEDIRETEAAYQERVRALEAWLIETEAKYLHAANHQNHMGWNYVSDVAKNEYRNRAKQLLADQPYRIEAALDGQGGAT